MGRLACTGRSSAPPRIRQQRCARLLSSLRLQTLRSLSLRPAGRWPAVCLRLRVAAPSGGPSGQRRRQRGLARHLSRRPKGTLGCHRSRPLRSGPPELRTSPTSYDRCNAHRRTHTHTHKQPSRRLCMCRERGGACKSSNALRDVQHGVVGRPGRVGRQQRRVNESGGADSALEPVKGPPRPPNENIAVVQALSRPTGMALCRRPASNDEQVCER